MMTTLSVHARSRSVARIFLGVLLTGSSAVFAEAEVTGVKAVCRNGQTFITWKDAAEGEAGAKIRYSIYRSDKPIGKDLAGAELCVAGVLNNSAKRFGGAFNMKDRLDPEKPTTIIEEKGTPLPMWSGLAVVTVKRDGKSCYAVLPTDEKGAALGAPAAMTEPIDETVAPIQPILLEDSLSRKGPYAKNLAVSGKKNMPLHLELHASNAQGGGAGEYGDCFLYFSRREWGWMDGLPGIFTVEERRDAGGGTLVLRSRDTIVTPAASAMETFWFGYVCVPQWAEHKEPRAYNFTEQRMLWVLQWVIKKYEADPERIYAGGGSMGAWGTTVLAYRHPEIFAAVYPNRPRTRQKGMRTLPGTPAAKEPVMMDDGKTPYLERMDTVKFVSDHHEDLPPYIWCCGRRDGFATWQEQVDMAAALTANHHGFAFAWNDGDHSSGAAPMSQVMKYYGPEKFARNKSYPAFGNSSINNDPGAGDPKNGDMEGGINLGFIWKDVTDEETQWSVKLSNDLCKEKMTVDVTPRRCQKFKPKAGDAFKWTNSAGGSGDVVADQWGLVTVGKVAILPGAETVLTIKK